MLGPMKIQESVKKQPLMAGVVEKNLAQLANGCKRMQFNANGCKMHANGIDL